MKNIYFVILTFIISSSLFSQEITAQNDIKRSQLIQQYSIFENDHRGFIVYFSDQTQISYPIDITFNTLDEAIVYFFSGGLMKDLICVSVLETQVSQPNFIGGVPIDMNQTIQKYIEIYQTN